MLHSRIVVTLLLASLAVAPGCKRDVPESSTASAGTAGVLDAPPIRVAEDNSGLAFRYFDPTEGKLVTVGEIDGVPDEVRTAVMVVDTNAKPAAPNVLYIADLTKKKDDGTYGYRVVDRYAYEQTRVPGGGTPGGEAAGAPSVTLYSTEWCGVCKKAKAWMKSNDIAFTERDVEKDPGALDDLRKAAEKAGVPFSSLARKVPVIVVNGKVLSGFDPGSIKAALGG